MASQYCDPSDLPLYIAASALQPISMPVQTQACIDASEEADSYMRSRVALPLLDWGTDIRRHTAYIAIYLLMAGRGYAPKAGADSLILVNYYKAVGHPERPGSGWFPGIQAQRITPDWTPSIPVGQDPGHDAPQVSSQPMRGWQQVRGGRPVVGGF
jgi:hypothetical protein